MLGSSIAGKDVYHQAFCCGGCKPSGAKRNQRAATVDRRRKPLNTLSLGQASLTVEQLLLQD